jgi:hypothetical protein
MELREGGQSPDEGEHVVAFRFAGSRFERHIYHEGLGILD